MDLQPPLNVCPPGWGFFAGKDASFLYIYVYFQSNSGWDEEESVLFKNSSGVTFNQIKPEQCGAAWSDCSRCLPLYLTS